ncbi:MAG: AAA family ATPase, partial [Lachnospiraceae bacterium]|nr:AAA family ATPase [Lachnospiraceae bacterium]
MAKAKSSVFFCQNCGYESAKWAGQCPACREWNTFVEEVVDRSSRQSEKARQASAELIPRTLSEISKVGERRRTTHMEEFDRVLGGGIVAGSMVLVGGDPGIGKSTLLLQLCRELCRDNVPILYISGEESLQ